MYIPHHKTTYFFHLKFFLENMLYASKTEINKVKTQILISRSSNVRIAPLNNQIAPLWGVGPTLGNPGLKEHVYLFIIKATRNNNKRNN